MSKAVLFLLATTLGLGFVSLHLVRELRAEREQAQSLQARVTELERTAARPSVGTVTPPSPSSPFAVTPMPSAPASSASAPKPARTASAAPTSMINSDAGPYSVSAEEMMRQMREQEEQQRALLQDPEYREAMRAQHKWSQAQMYPDLAQELDLSDEELDQFTTLLADQQMRGTEASTAMFARSPDPAEIEEAQRKLQQVTQANEAEQASLLGPTRFQAWKEYQATLGVRHQVMQMRSTFAGKGLALQESQVKPLIKALAEEQQRAMKEWRAEQGVSNAVPSAMLGTSVAFLESSADPSIVNSGFVGNEVSIDNADEKSLERMRQANKRTRDALASILTPQQLKAYEEEQNTQLKLQQAQLRMIRAQMRAQPSGR